MNNGADQQTNLSAKTEKLSKKPAVIDFIFTCNHFGIGHCFCSVFSNCIYPDKRCPAFDTGSVFLDIQF